LVKELRLGFPLNEEDLFDKLSKKGVIEIELAEKLKTMRRFRNVLRYSNLDDGRVYDFLCHDIKDLEEFIRRVRDHIL
jgi:uncharacterized protein YutE (UPF0331/DUF86 family)